MSNKNNIVQNSQSLHLSYTECSNKNVLSVIKLKTH